MTLNKNFFKKDSFAFGLLIGIVVPALTFLLFFGVNYFIKIYFNPDKIIKLSVIHLLSVLIDLLPMRYYFTKKLDKTARGVFLCVFIIGIIFFVIKY